jgi:hypothetical protein
MGLGVFEPVIIPKIKLSLRRTLVLQGVLLS